MPSVVSLWLLLLALLLMAGAVSTCLLLLLLLMWLVTFLVLVVLPLPLLVLCASLVRAEALVLAIGALAPCCLSVFKSCLSLAFDFPSLPTGCCLGLGLLTALMVSSGLLLSTFGQTIAEPLALPVVFSCRRCSLFACFWRSLLEGATCTYTNKR